jgi:hypothetical protein
MSYTFTPKTEEELEQGDLMPDGLYSFEVTKAERKISQAGNPMAALQLLVWEVSGKSRIVFDYLIFSDVSMCIKKVKHFCDTTGLKAEYLQGNIPEDLSGLSGKLWIVTQDEQVDPKTGKRYPKKNVVDDYESEKQAKKADTGEPFVDSDLSDLPF